MTNAINSGQAYQRVSYPGELGIPPVGVVFDIPAGWTIAAVQGALAVAREPEPGPEGFWANVVTSIDRVGPSASLDRITSDILADAQESSTTFHLSDERIVEVSGVPAVLREQVLQVEASPLTLVQFVLVLLVDVGEGRARDCVQITGSVEDGRRDLLATVFERLTAGLALDA
jgi:hypothetical protein